MPLNSRRTFAIGTFGLVCTATLAISAAAWRGERLNLFAGQPEATGETPVTVTVGGETLTSPANRLRFSDQHRPGNYARIELELTWPGLAAPQPDDPIRLTTARDGRLVFVSIEPRETDLDTADRIATIYKKFLAATDTADRVNATPSGLIRQKFLAGTSYEGEELYFEPGSVHPFAARCFPLAKGEAPASCLRDVRLGKRLIATIRFPIAALADWRGFRDKTDEILAEMVEGSG